MTVQVYRQTKDGKTAVIPDRKTPEAAGYDVTAYLADDFMFLPPLQTVMVPTGLHIAPPPFTTVLVTSRSGLSAKGIIVVNGPGVIDSDYRGEIKVLLMYVAHPDTAPFRINHGDRIGQLLFVEPSALSFGVQFLPASNLDDLRPTLRGEGGFGSTGR